MKNIVPLSPTAARSSRNLTCTQAAKQLGWGESRLRNYETGVREPKATVVDQLAELYLLTPTQLKQMVRWFKVKAEEKKKPLPTEPVGE